MNAICPGAIDTPMLRVFVNRPDQPGHNEADPEALIKAAVTRSPMGRAARPEEIAEVAAVRRGVVCNWNCDAGRWWDAGIVPAKVSKQDPDLLVDAAGRYKLESRDDG